MVEIVVGTLDNGTNITSDRSGPTKIIKSTTPEWLRVRSWFERIWNIYWTIKFSKTPKIADQGFIGWNFRIAIFASIKIGFSHKLCDITLISADKKVCERVCPYDKNLDWKFAKPMMFGNISMIMRLCWLHIALTDSDYNIVNHYCNYFGYFA